MCLRPLLKVNVDLNGNGIQQVFGLLDKPRALLRAEEVWFRFFSEGQSEKSNNSLIDL